MGMDQAVEETMAVGRCECPAVLVLYFCYSLLAIRLYSEGKQSAAQLAAQYGCSIKAIHRYLSKAATQAECALPQTPVNLTHGYHTYFGHQWGVMVLYDARSKRTLTAVAVERETNALYTQAVAALREKACDTKHYLRWQKRLAGFVPGYTRADVPVSSNQKHSAPPDQEA